MKQITLKTIYLIHKTLTGSAETAPNRYIFTSTPTLKEPTVENALKEANRCSLDVSVVRPWRKYAKILLVVEAYEKQDN